jgi:hypothetical protein
MKRSISSPIGYYFAALISHSIFSIALGTLIFLISFTFVDPSMREMFKNSNSLFWYLMLGAGLGLMAYTLRGVFLALIISGVLTARPSIYVPLLTLVLSILIFCFIGPRSSPRDYCLIIGGIIGNTVATFLVQKVFPRKAPNTAEQDAAANP